MRCQKFNCPCAADFTISFVSKKRVAGPHSQPVLFRAKHACRKHKAEILALVEAERDKLGHVWYHPIQITRCDGY